MFALRDDPRAIGGSAANSGLVRGVVGSVLALPRKIFPQISRQAEVLRLQQQQQQGVEESTAAEVGSDGSAAGGAARKQRSSRHEQRLTFLALDGGVLIESEIRPPAAIPGLDSAVCASLTPEEMVA